MGTFCPLQERSYESYLGWYSSYTTQNISSWMFHSAVLVIVLVLNRTMVLVTRWNWSWLRDWTRKFLAEGQKQVQANNENTATLWNTAYKMDFLISAGHNKPHVSRFRKCPKRVILVVFNFAWCEVETCENSPSNQDQLNEGHDTSFTMTSEDILASLSVSAFCSRQLPTWSPDLRAE